MTLPVSDAPSVSSSLSLFIYIFTRPGRLPLTMYNSAPHGRSLRSFFFYRSVKNHTKTFLKETSSYLLFAYQLLFLTACFVSSVNQFPGTLLSDPPPFTLRIIIVQPDQRLLLHSTMFKLAPAMKPDRRLRLPEDVKVPLPRTALFQRKLLRNRLRLDCLLLLVFCFTISSGR